MRRTATVLALAVSFLVAGCSGIVGERGSGDLVSEMGAVNNAKLASQFFKDRIGTIEVGAKADLILVDYKPITDMTEGNLPWHILFGFRDSQVTTTIINGKTVMKDRVISGIDEAEIAQRAVGLSQEVWKRYQKQF
jgi:cytosine/adenosine deaminase-related metal-dependent hydrolase